MSGISFVRQIKKFTKVAEGNANEAVRKIAMGILANVVIASPVDTGRFRGNWQVGLGVWPAGTLDLTNKDSASVIDRAGPALTGYTPGTTIFIANNLPYAIPLEYGYSQQAPQGMVRLTFRNLKHIIAGATKK